MDDPTGQVLGVGYAALLAAFSGAVVALSLNPQNTLKRAMMAVAAGTLSGAYLAPAALVYFHVDGPLQGAAAFLTGLCAMVVLPRILDLAGRLPLPGTPTDKQGN